MPMHPASSKILQLVAITGIDGKNQVAIACALLHAQHEWAVLKDPEYKNLFESIGGEKAFPTRIEQASAYLAFLSDKVNKQRSSESSQIEA